MSPPSITIIDAGPEGLTTAHIVVQLQQRPRQGIPHMHQKPLEQAPALQAVFMLKSRSYNNVVRIPKFKLPRDVLRPVRVVRVKAVDEPTAFGLRSRSAIRWPC